MCFYLKIVLKQQKLHYIVTSLIFLWVNFRNSMPKYLSRPNSSCFLIFYRVCFWYLQLFFLFSFCHFIQKIKDKGRVASRRQCSQVSSQLENIAEYHRDCFLEEFYGQNTICYYQAWLDTQCFFWWGFGEGRLPLLHTQYRLHKAAHPLHSFIYSPTTL